MDKEDSGREVVRGGGSPPGAQVWGRVERLPCWNGRVPERKDAGRGAFASAW